MKLVTAEFKKVLKKIKLGMKTTKIEATQYIYIKDELIFSYCDRYAVSAPMKETYEKSDVFFEICVNGKEFIAGIEKIKAKEITLVYKNSQLVVIAGRLNLKFTAIEDEYYTELIDEIAESQSSDDHGWDSDWTEDGFENFLNGLIFASSCVSKNLSDGTLCCVIVDNEQLIASNNCQIVLWEVYESGDFQPFKIYGDAVALLKQVGTTNIKMFHITKSWIHFHIHDNEDAYGDILSIRRIEGPYPDMLTLFEGYDSLPFYSFPVGAETVLGIIKKISGNAAVLEVSENEMIISTPEDITKNAVIESFEIEYDGEPFKVMVAIDALGDMIKEEAEFTKGENLFIRHEKYDYITTWTQV
jgi:hypothetical protein